MIPSKEAHGLEPAPPPRVERRLANDAEEPGPHRGPTVVARAPVQDFEVCRLQHVLSLLPPEAAACQRPAVARRVKPFDLSLERRHFLAGESRERPFHMTRRYLGDLRANNHLTGGCLHAKPKVYCAK